MGKHLSDIITGYNARAPLAEAHTIPSSWYIDSRVAELENDAVFGRAWQAVGRTDQIAESGQFFTADVAGERIVVVRSADRELRAFYNVCRHHAAAVVTEAEGHAANFRCPYHGWTYGHDGRVESMPSQRKWLGAGGDKSDYTLIRARVETRGGLMFGTWNEDLPDLETYLGDFAFYFDAIFCAVDKNLEVTGPPQRWRLPFNWKLGTENSLGDAYHAQSAHASVADIGLVPEMTKILRGAIGSDRRWGHAFLATFLDQWPSLEAALHWLPAEVVPQTEHHLSEQQMTMLRNGTPANIATIFPHFSWSFSDTFFLVRIWQPVTPNTIDLWTWTLAHPDATADQKRDRDRALNMTFGVTGLIAQDDLAIFARSQRAAEGLVGSRAPVTYASTNGAPDKRGYLTDGGEWPGPGDIWISDFPADDHMWNFYLRWLHLMTGEKP